MRWFLTFPSSFDTFLQNGISTHRPPFFACPLCLNLNFLLRAKYFRYTPLTHPQNLLQAPLDSSSPFPHSPPQKSHNQSTNFRPNTLHSLNQPSDTSYQIFFFIHTSLLPPRSLPLLPPSILARRP